jgi:sec-independent protein translocase protein TatC
MSDAPETDRETTLVEHLIELRNRLLRCLLAIGLLFAGMFPFSNRIYDYASAPLRVYLPEGSSMIATDVAAPFFAPMKLTFVAAVLAAMPVILYQAWAFIAPGLYKRERHIVLPLFASSVILFYGGMAFAYYLVFPLIFGFFTSVGPEHVAVMTDISRYLDFVLKLFFAFGFAFEIPVAVVILSWTGLVNPQALAEKRPYVIVGCFTVGMLLTPPDVFSQTLLALPMWLLFELGIVCGRWVYRTKTPDEETTTLVDEGN